MPASGADETPRDDFHMQTLGLEKSDDDSLRGLHYILEAWEKGCDDGVAPELMAYAAIYTALSDLVATYGEEAVAGMAAALEPRVRRGEFTLYRSQQ